MSEQVAKRTLKLVTAVQRAIKAADWEPDDAQRALRELRDVYQSIVREAKEDDDE